MVSNLNKADEVTRAGTLVLDSATRLGDHLKRQILYLDPQGTSTLSQRDWGSYLGMFEETFSVLIDVARSADMDLIVCVHERVSEIPGPNTKIIRSPTGKSGESSREFIGTMQIKMAPSIEGQFGLRVASFFEEVYRLECIEGRWRCFTRPDGKYDLRTSYMLGAAEHDPDFRKIWKDGQRTGVPTRE
jgi:hypothetical protein